MEIYVIRHGETVWNAKGLLQGREDIELSEKGRELAGNYGRELESVHFDCIYSSPLMRAYETACLIRGHRNIPILRDDRLREISFGEMEGKYYGDWKTDPNCRYYSFFHDPAAYDADHPKDGESFTSACERAASFLKEEIEPRYKDCKRVMIVAHGALNKALMCRMEGNSIDNYWGKGLQTNCQASIFSYDETGYHVIQS